MTVVRIEHQVSDYDAWKRAFDADPAGRERSGVSSYRILRDADDPGFIMIDLELDTEEHARALLASLQVVWSQVQGALISAPGARIAHPAESVEY